MGVFLIAFASTIFFYNFCVFVFSVGYSLAHLFTKFEFRFGKGYNLIRLSISTSIIFFSLFCYLRFFNILKSDEFDLILFLKCIPWLSGLIILVFFLRISQPYSLLEWIRMYRNKDIKDEDLLEPKNLDDTSNFQTIVSNNYQNNINTFKTEVSIDNSTSETHVDNSITNNNLQQPEKLRHPLLKGLSNDELNLIIRSFSKEIIIENDSVLNLYRLFEGKVKKSKIEIIVVNQTNKLNYRKGIDFLRKIIHFDNILNPFSEKEFSKKETAHFIDSNFVLKSTLGKQKDEIVVNDVYYDSLRP